MPGGARRVQRQDPAGVKRPQDSEASEREGARRRPVAREVRG